MRLRRAALLVPLLAAGLALVGCAGTARTTDTHCRDGSTLRVVRVDGLTIWWFLDENPPNTFDGRRTGPVPQRALEGCRQGFATD